MTWSSDEVCELRRVLEEAEKARDAAIARAEAAEARVRELEARNGR